MEKHLAIVGKLIAIGGIRVDIDLENDLLAGGQPAEIVRDCIAAQTIFQCLGATRVAVTPDEVLMIRAQS